MAEDKESGFEKTLERIRKRHQRLVKMGGYKENPYRENASREVLVLEERPVMLGKAAKHAQAFRGIKGLKPEQG